MGRGKIEIKKIEDSNARQVTFSKRRNGLLKKAKELSTLCEAQIGVIIISSTNRVYEFSSTSMENILSRYARSLEMGCADHPSEELGDKLKSETNALREEIAALRLAYSRTIGQELDGLSLKELKHLEHQLTDGMLSVKNKKEQVLLEHVKESRLQEQKAMLENDGLRKQIEDFQIRSISSSIELNPLQRSSSKSLANNSTESESEEDSKPSRPSSLM